ncbi:hydroxymethylglutaryl-CoA lyase [Rhizobiales bacterium GAS113]|nr:hydroxymethylglutaryl-CoA lyase [Rhizobiales bacterium GAS113]SED25504.1 hydroxymethylglutaryl-CoA lyase [Rhizobiales bacterium GAS188]
MSDLPKFVHINEEGPREGFQFEKGAISTARKIELIDALSATGLRTIQVASFVNPKNVPGWADAEAVVAGFERKPGVRYTALWLNAKGFERAAATQRLDITGSITLTASATFLKRNQNRNLAQNLEAQREIIDLYRQHGTPIERGAIMAAFGCNFEGDIKIATVLALIEDILALAAEHKLDIKVMSLADTMAWATPLSIKRMIGAVRERHPDLRLALHLHDTRGMGIANALAGLEMGVDIFDAAVAGLGGCPFAAHKGAAGNVCTEDLVFMLQEMGIETGVDLEKLIAAAELAEDIVGHPLPGSVKVGGPLDKMRAAHR